jgi:hypothetical protein
MVSNSQKTNDKDDKIIKKIQIVHQKIKTHENARKKTLNHN